MSYDYEDEEEPDRGVFNTLWLLKAALAQVPQPHLVEGIYEMIDYLVGEEEPNVGEALDLLGQVALTGHFHPPYEEVEAATTLTDEEIDAEVIAFNRVIRGIPEVKKSNEEGESA